MVEMRAWTEPGGDPSPLRATRHRWAIASVGNSAGRGCGEIVLTEAQWTQLEALGDCGAR